MHPGCEVTDSLPRHYVPPVDARDEVRPGSVALHGVLWRRAVAYGVDVVIIFALEALAWLLFIPATILSFGLLASPLAILFAFIPIAYHTLLIGGPGSATLGQRLFGLRVIDLTGARPSYLQAAVQSALFYVTVLATSFLVLLFVFFNTRRRTLHDLLSGTLVVRSGVELDAASTAAPTAHTRR